jgi:hypothetical protein
MAKAEQQGLPGVPQAPRRKVIEEIEELSLEIDKLAGKRTALSDKIATESERRQEMLVKHKLEVYTYEDASGVLQDVTLETKSRKRKSKLNPRKTKASAEA